MGYGEMHQEEKLEEENDALPPQRLHTGETADVVDEKKKIGLGECFIPELSTTIGATLGILHKKYETFPESQQMAEHVHARFEFLFEKLLQKKKAPTDDEVAAFIRLFIRFQQYYLRTAFSDDSIKRYQRSRKVQELSHVFHSNIDTLLDILRVPDADPIRHWRSVFDNHRKERPDGIKISGLGVKVGDGKPESVRLIEYKSTHSSFDWSIVASYDIGDSSFQGDYPWFLPLHEIVFDDCDRFAKGSFGKLYRGKWRNYPVVVKCMGYDGDPDTTFTKIVSTKVFLHEVRIWYQLRHPHIVALFGACHLGKRYFVSEDASNGTLRDFLKHNEGGRLEWQKLYEVALGLEYMHGRNIVHNDLKCDNILVGADGKAKLIDFGLSSILNKAEVMVDLKNMGGVHWRSPEYLAGGRPSFASDIYSFAMCIMEAVSGDFPWGSNTHAAYVRRSVIRERRIPNRPPEMTDEQMKLVITMTARDPLERVDILYVVKELHKFASAESDATRPNAPHIATSAAPTSSSDAGMEGEHQEIVKQERDDGEVNVHVVSMETLEPIALVAHQWFLPFDQLVIRGADYLGEASFGAIYRGVWRGTSIVVKFMGDEKGQEHLSSRRFLHEVRIWYQLRHPHIVAFFGACHLGKRYFVSEYASQGKLLEYLGRSENRGLVWQKLYEVALGLEYMHGRNIVHNDLKCDNILVGADGKAKLIDFGLSSILNKAEVMVDLKNMGGVHWRSPEYLAGGRPSFASDIYSFAMCIMEAVSGDFPWGRYTSADTVRDQVSEGIIPDRPELVTDEQWGFIELMTSRDPSQRVKISYVSNVLARFAREALAPVQTDTPRQDVVDDTKPSDSLSQTSNDDAIDANDNVPVDPSRPSISELPTDPEEIDLILTSQWDNFATEAQVLITNARLTDSISPENTTEEERGRMPLFAAAFGGDMEEIRALIENGASVDDKDEDGRTPLFYATANAAQMLIDNGASMDTVDNRGMTPLLASIERGDWMMANVLIQNGVPLNRASSDSEAPVTLAGRIGHMRIFEALIEAGASVNVRGDDGETPLVSAARWGFFDGVQLLLMHSDSISSSYVLDDECPLLPSTLETMTHACAASFEFEPMFAQVMTRLNDIYTEVQLLESTQIQQDAIRTFWNIIYRVCRVLVECGNYTSPLSRFIRSRGVSSKVRDFHKELDHFLDVFDMNHPDSSWGKQWEEDRLVQSRLFQEELGSDEVLASSLRNDVDKHEAAVLLRYEMMTSGADTSEEDLKAVEEVMDRVLRVCSVEKPKLPGWFIPRDDVEFEHWNAVEGDVGSRIFKGRWLKTSVMVATSTVELDDFEQHVSRWHQLSHPHVAALYGACHVGPTLFLVYEFSPNGALLDLLRIEENRHLTWAKLHEASLGLQYLHERNVIHGDLRCCNLTIGSDMKTRLAGIEQDNWNRETSSTQYLDRWRSPELLRGERVSFASDIYALGMCVLEAVTMGDDTWMGSSGESFFGEVSSGHFPDRPENMNAAAWSLILRMCDSNPSNRVNLVYVVTQLKRFSSRDVELQFFDENQNVNIENLIFPNLGTTIERTIKTIESSCARDPEPQWIAELVTTSVHFIFDRLVHLKKGPGDDEVEKFCSLLTRIRHYLQSGVSERSIARTTRSLKVAYLHQVMYAEVDALLEMLNVPEEDPMRTWKRSKIDIVKQILQSGTSAMIPPLDKGKVDVITLVQNEFSSNSSGIAANKYAWSQARLSLASSSPPSWYLPLLEIQCDRRDEIGEGSFASVYIGKWMDTPVAIKFMGYEEEHYSVPTKLFLHEVQIWCQLKHPHIVRLFGANHVGNRYMVMEIASNGTIREYLKFEVDKNKTWTKLYEVALGLQYLHGLNIVHNDFKCDNILIGADNKAKLIDFGLSSIPNLAEVMVDTSGFGAVHWKSPEYLSGERPSLASDIYSFAMCILEAVTGDFPWGNQVPPAVVRYHVRKGRLPNRPDAMNDTQWKLIELMTRRDPMERVKIAFVVEKLHEMTRDEVSSALP